LDELLRLRFCPRHACQLGQSHQPQHARRRWATGDVLQRVGWPVSGVAPALLGGLRCEGAWRWSCWARYLSKERVYKIVPLAWQVPLDDI